MTRIRALRSAARRCSASGSVATHSADAPAVERGLRDVDRSVPVALRLDDGPELGPARRHGAASRRSGESAPRSRVKHDRSTPSIVRDPTGWGALLDLRLAGARETCRCPRRRCRRRSRRRRAASRSRAPPRMQSLPLPPRSVSTPALPMISSAAPVPVNVPDTIRTVERFSAAQAAGLSWFAVGAPADGVSARLAGTTFVAVIATPSERATAARASATRAECVARGINPSPRETAASSAA